MAESDEHRVAIYKAIRDAFDAGAEQGSEEATAYEWGQPPRQKREEAFADFMADWNRESAPLRTLISAADRIEKLRAALRRVVDAPEDDADIEEWGIRAVAADALERDARAGGGR